MTLALVVVCAIPLSKIIADAYAGERNFLTPVLGPVERAFYRLAGVDPAREQDWFAYTVLRPQYVETGRPLCANSCHSATARRTGRIDRKMNL